MTSSDGGVASRGWSRLQAVAAYSLEASIAVAVYIVLAKGGLALASIEPSAAPIWPASGFSLSVLLLRGYRLWPAILLGSFLANALLADASAAGSFATAAAIAFGNLLEAGLGTHLINRFAGGRYCFESPGGIARFVLISFVPTALSATVGTTVLALNGEPGFSNFGLVWFTWWLGDFAGTLMVAPAIVLWARTRLAAFDRAEVGRAATAYVAAGCVGAIAFSPFVDAAGYHAPLGVLVILPLLWSALRCGERDTATVALILSAAAVWGTLSGNGLFDRETQNESFLLLLVFMIGIAVPCIALSADVAARKRTEAELRRIQDELNQRVEARTAALMTANRTLQDEIERRKRVEAELDQQTRHLLQAQRLAKLGSWMRDLRSNEVVCSEQIYEIFGLDPQQPGGVSFESYLNCIHPDDRVRVYKEILQAIESGQGIHGERRIVRPNGEIRYLQTRVEMVKDEEGNTVYAHGICLDVTDRKQAELALERTREQLAQVQKMEAIGQLTGGIAHDFNNLLMIISGHAEMLRRRLGDPKATQGLEAIETAARRGESLTRQLLTFSRRQPLNPVPIDLRQQVEAVSEMLASSLRGNITLVIDLPEALWPVEVDVAEFELALVNIAVNARDAMPEGGTFTVSARNVAAGSDGAGQPAGDYVVLSLSDTGSGIAPDMLPKIFDPFFTTKAVGKGTGLGLSQVYGFASQSGGSVSASSEVGRGTTISLYLPRKEAAALPVAERTDLQGTVPGEGMILVVEDNGEVAAVTRDLLEQLGYKVALAGNAAEALARLRNGESFDLLFSDIVMPAGMNGIHLAQEVCERYPGICVLLTTGYSDVATGPETRFPVLRKPFDLSTLERAIREALGAAPARCNIQSAAY